MYINHEEVYELLEEGKKASRNDILNILEKAREKMKDENVYYLENKEEILEVLKKVIKPGDVVLLKASNGMKFYELAERMISLWKKKD